MQQQYYASSDLSFDLDPSSYFQRWSRVQVQILGVQGRINSHLGRGGVHHLFSGEWTCYSGCVSEITQLEAEMNIPRSVTAHPPQILLRNLSRYHARNSKLAFPLCARCLL